MSRERWSGRCDSSGDGRKGGCAWRAKSRLHHQLLYFCAQREWLVPRPRGKIQRSGACVSVLASPAPPRCKSAACFCKQSWRSCTSGLGILKDLSLWLSCGLPKRVTPATTHLVKKKKRNESGRGHGKLCRVRDTRDHPRQIEPWQRVLAKGSA